MARVYQPKLLPDGGPNPKHYKRTNRTWDAARDRTGDTTRKRSGRTRTRWERNEIVAIDGEGETIAGRHRYTMLCAAGPDGAETLLRAEPGKQLTTAEILPALLNLIERYPKAIITGFSLGYDVNMWLQSMPKGKVQRLWEHRSTTYTPPSGYTIRVSYTPRKSISLTQYYLDANGTRRKRGGTIWDVFGFFQSSFVQALDTFGANESVRQRIAEMKARRSTFDSASRDDVEAYCHMECEALRDMVTQLFQDIRAAGLTLKRYDGAGAVSSELLRSRGVKQHNELQAPEAVHHAHQYAYFGGRVEAPQYGHHEGIPIYAYDIRSAYPAAMQHLPATSGMKWERIPPDAPIASLDAPIASLWASRFSLYYIRFSFPPDVPLYPLPWRANDGAIYFPRQGEGWYWWPEAMEAWKRYPNCLTILDRWQGEPASDVKPFAWIPGDYETRARWKRQGNGAEKALKLGLNGSYGKLAQRVGSQDGKPPGWHNLAWAGYITSATRARIYTAAMQQPDAIIAIATDGIYSTKPLLLPLGRELGAWELREYEGITLLQSGVYRCLTAKGEWEHFTRGFDRSLDIWELALTGWREGRESIAMPNTRFIGMGMALTGGTRWNAWCQWETTDREISLTPANTKRQDRARVRRGAPARRLIPTWPRDLTLLQSEQGRKSAPTDLPWSDLRGPSPEEVDAYGRVYADSADGSEA